MLSLYALTQHKETRLDTLSQAQDCTGGSCMTRLFLHGPERDLFL